MALAMTLALTRHNARIDARVDAAMAARSAPRLEHPIVSAFCSALFAGNVDGRPRPGAQNAECTRTNIFHEQSTTTRFADMGSRLEHV
jgi:hypothetical protein